MIAAPKLQNDCFALPPGVDWVPVDTALEHLRNVVRPIAPVETLPLQEAHNRLLAKEVRALRSNPPHPNSAVDGYGFAHASLGTGEQVMNLVSGRAAAGIPFDATVPSGMAIRILTGAILPSGVDTVVLEEDVTAQAGQIAFHPGLKIGANTREAGEDVMAGEAIVSKGTRLRAPELSIMAAVGVSDVPVFAPLRIGVLSTGDEIVTKDAAYGQIFDANRPMLLALAQEWNCIPVDLGHVRDDRAALADALDAGADVADVILTTGGASAGDEDHVSALMRDHGSLGLWRIALKPGRPLALGMWRGVPVFGLPGNPVAALVCSLVFASRAVQVMGGGAWSLPKGVMVPAAFGKKKKAGRREFLRARLTSNGHVEVFASEGSGRISGLAWADGLVELDDGARDVSPGDMVRYIPFESFRP